VTGVTTQRARSEVAKRRRRRDMLSAARTLAVRDGVRAVTLAAVTTASGLHPSAVRRYFDSKEELLLELAEQEWQTWSSAVVTRLRGRTDLPAADIAATLVDTLAAQPLFCDLSTHVVLSLEDGVGYARARQYKASSFEAYDKMAAAIASASALQLAGAQDVLSATLALAAYLWQVAHPGPVLAAIYADVPRWGHVATNFELDLRRLLAELILGAEQYG
jgi:AcrR family transcriptional regulator